MITPETLIVSCSGSCHYWETCIPGATAGLPSSAFRLVVTSMKQHRKTIKHYEQAGHFHELTFSCQNRRPLLKNQSWLELLSASINNAIAKHHYHLHAFVFMPEHVHLLVHPKHKASTISSLLNAIKRPFSYRIKQLLLKGNHELLEELTVRQRPGVTAFRFWLEGPGYDRNITDTQTLDHVINYIHHNPVKRKLCERAVDWKWSSARFYYLTNFCTDTKLPRLTPLPKDAFN